MNLQVSLLEPWGAAGRFAASAQSSDPEVQAVVLEAARARMVVAWRCVQGSQIVARHYHGDIPRNSQPLTLLVPGVPEAHQAWEVSPGGLRPLRHKRVTGGISVTLESFRAHSLILLSGDRHLAEISQLPAEVTGYPLTEITSSALTQSGGSNSTEVNKHRIGENYTMNNFGSLTVDWSRTPALITASIHNIDGAPVRAFTIPAPMRAKTDTGE
jgi:hypothetical protein